MKPDRMLDDRAQETQAESSKLMRHCAVLALLGLVAVAIGIALPRDDRARPAPARDPTSAAQPATASPLDVRLPTPTVAESSAPAGMAFEYFPAQFPAPRGDAEEQPATF